MSFTAWLSIFLVSLLGAMSPGPSLAVVVKNTLGGNRVNGILTGCCHSLGIGVYALVSVLGLSVILQKNPTVYMGITYTGATYLAWLGINSLRSKGGIAAKLKLGQQQTYIQSMRDGFLISVCNPKIGLFFLALFSQFIHEQSTTIVKTITILTPILTDAAWFSLVALIISNKKILNILRDRAVIFDRIIGIILLIISMRIFFAF